MGGGGDARRGDETRSPQHAAQLKIMKAQAGATEGMRGGDDSGGILEVGPV